MLLCHSCIMWAGYIVPLPWNSSWERMGRGGGNFSPSTTLVIFFIWMMISYFLIGGNSRKMWTLGPEDKFTSLLSMCGLQLDLVHLKLYPCYPIKPPHWEQWGEPTSLSQLLFLCDIGNSLYIKENRIFFKNHQKYCSLRYIISCLFSASDETHWTCHWHLFLGHWF